MNGSYPFAGADFFQFGYVTDDLDSARALWRKRYGVEDFLTFNSRDFAEAGATGPFIKVALAWRGATMIELIEPDLSDPGIYRDALRAEGGVMLHHLGYLVSGDRFAALEAIFAASHIPVPMVRASAISFLYADTRVDTGLFSEMVFPGEAGERLFAAVPRF